MLYISIILTNTLDTTALIRANDLKQSSMDLSLLNTTHKQKPATMIICLYIEV